MAFKNLTLLDMTKDIVLPEIHTQNDHPSPIVSMEDKLVKDLELLTTDELNTILKSNTEEEENEEQLSEPDLTPDEAVINEMVQGLCTKKQKTTFVKIIARYIR